MTTLQLRHVDCFTDRHGHKRYYFRRGHGPRIALPGLPGEANFMAAYQAALGSEKLIAKLATKKLRGGPGSFDRLVQDYFISQEFLRLKPPTQRAYRHVIERFVLDEKIGHRLVAEMRREHDDPMIAKRAETPGAANDLLKKIRVLIHFAIDNGWRADDPTLRMKKYAAGEWHTWTDDEIAMFEARWPKGTCERTAFALLLCTGQRRSDVVRMAWDDVDNGSIRVVQGKTGAKLSIPLHPDLSAALSVWPPRGERILVTTFGKPFTSNGFGNFMADKIAEAGLPDRCVTHRLRKAAARLLAEAGCTANEIAAITGHRTLVEVSRYTKAADQVHLAQTAIDRLTARQSAQRVPTPVKRVGKNPEKSNEINVDLFNWRTGQDETANTYVIEIYM